MACVIRGKLNSEYSEYEREALTALLVEGTQTPVKDSTNKALHHLPTILPRHSGLGSPSLIFLEKSGSFLITWAFGLI